MPTAAITSVGVEQTPLLASPSDIPESSMPIEINPIIPYANIGPGYGSANGKVPEIMSSAIMTPPISLTMILNPSKSILP